FYDILRFGDGSVAPIRVRSLVGLIPLYAVERLEGKWIEPFPSFRENLDWFLKHRREIVEQCVTTVKNDHDFTHVLAVVDQNQLQHLLARVAERLIDIFLPDADGYRPVFGPRGTRKSELFAKDPHWRHLVWFHEYFNGDTGEGLGASHQTGWTGLIANVIDEWRR